MRLPWQPARKKARKRSAPKEQDELTLTSENLEREAYAQAYREALQHPEARRQLIFEKWGINAPAADPIQQEREKLITELAPKLKKLIMDNPELRHRFVRNLAQSMVEPIPQEHRCRPPHGLGSGASMYGQPDDAHRLAQKTGYSKGKDAIYTDIVNALIQARPQLAVLPQQLARQADQPSLEQQANPAPRPPPAEPSAPQRTYCVVMPDGSLKDMSEPEYALWRGGQAQPAPDSPASSAPAPPNPAAEVESFPLAVNKEAAVVEPTQPDRRGAMS
jgi:hypothetical protein